MERDEEGNSMKEAFEEGWENDPIEFVGRFYTDLKSATFRQKHLEVWLVGLAHFVLCGNSRVDV